MKEVLKEILMQTESKKVFMNDYTRTQFVIEIIRWKIKFFNKKMTKENTHSNLTELQSLKTKNSN